jgi:hypothetical protein
MGPRGEAPAAPATPIRSLPIHAAGAEVIALAIARARHHPAPAAS